MLVTPTAARHYTIAEMLADPIRLNSNLGFYTNFMNLLDLAGVAIPAGFQPDGLPFGVTLAAPAFSDAALLEPRRRDSPRGRTSAWRDATRGCLQNAQPHPPARQ